MRLGSSSRRSGITLRPEGIVDDSIATGVIAGRELIELARSAVLTAPDPGATTALAATIGAEAAMTAVEVAGAFELTNRVVEATGLPAPKHSAERTLPVLEALGATAFPHARVTAARKPSPRWRRAARRLRRRGADRR